MSHSYREDCVVGEHVDLADESVATAVQPRPDVLRELRDLGRRLDTRKGTFPFAHARMAWLESHRDMETC